MVEIKILVITNDEFSRLADISVGVSVIRAVMAYWTISASDLPGLFVQRLKNAEGFLRGHP